MTVLRSQIITIGNFQGLRLPKTVIEQLNMHEEVELEVQDNQLIVRPLHPPRQNWEAQFQIMAANNDDQLLDNVVPTLTEWDDKEWEWS